MRALSLLLLPLLPLLLPLGCCAQTDPGSTASTSSPYLNLTHYLDPSTPETSIVSDAIQQLLAYLGAESETDGEDHGEPRDDDFGDETETGDKPTTGLAINGLMQSFLPRDPSDDEPYLEFSIDGGYLLEVGAGATAVSVNVTTVRAKGFDTFYESDLLRPTPFPSGPGEGGSSGGVPDDGGVSEPEEEGDETVDPETVIQNSFSLRRLVIELEFTEQSGSNSGTGATSVVALPFEDAVFWDLPVRMDLVPERLLDFPLGAFLDPGGGYLMPCFRSVLDHLEILAIGVRFGSVLAPVLLRAGGEAPPGGSSNGGGSGSPFVDLLTGLFVGLPIAVPIFFETTVRNILNDLLWKEEGDLDPEDTVCPYYDAATMEGHTRSDGITGVAIPGDALVDLWDFFGGGLPGVLKNYLVDETLLVAAVADDPGGNGNSNSNSTGTGTTNNDYYYYGDENNQLLAINQVLVEPMLESSLFEGPGVTVDAGSIGHPMVLGGGESPPLVDVDTELAIGGLSAAIKLAVSDLRIVNLNTMKAPMELLEPSEDHPQLLANRLTVGMEHWPGERTDSQTAGAIRPLGVSARIALEVETTGDEKGIGHDVTVEMGMETLSVLLEGILEVNTQKLYGFPAGDLTNPSCWLATLRRASDREAEGEFEFQRDASPTGMGIADLEASLARLHLGIACNGKDNANANANASGKVVCTTPEMQAWTTELLPTPEAQEGATSAMNSVLAYAGDLLSGGAVLEDPIDRMLSDAARKCPHSPTYDPSASAETETDTGFFAAAGESTLPPYEHRVGQLVFWGSLALGVLVGVALVSLVVERIVRRRNRRWLEEDCPEPMRRILSAKQAAEDAREAGLNASTSAMVASPSIPFCVRWGMPLVVLGNIALFLSGHLNVGATVAISASLAGDTIAVDEFFSFSIARSTVDIWKAGGKELAILILVFSGIWPYTKQALTLWLWFVPPHRLSVSKRGSCLLWIDRLAKWSMVDIFVIVVCIAAFRVSVSSPDTLAFLPEGFYSADLLVVPRWGLYANMIAQLVSQVSSHFVIHYHRRIVAEATEAMAERARDPLREEEGPPEPFGSQDEEGGSGARDGIPSPEDKGSRGSVALRFRSFSLYHGSDGEKLVVRGWISSAMAAMGLAVLVFVVVGCLLPSFSLEILGMIGIAVESGQEFEPAITNHSIGSIVGLLWEEAGFLDSAKAYTGIAVLGALFVSTVSIVPILQAAGLLYQWFVPLTETKRNRMSVCNEILQAWQYIEVYLIALFVASWQLGPISEYMFNTYCGSLDGFFAQMVRYGVIEEEDAQCFTVQAMLEPGSIALVVAAVLLALLNSLVTKAAKQVAFDTENERFCLNYARVQCSQNDPTDDGSGTSGSSHPGGSEEKCGTVAEAKNTNPIRPIPVMFTDTYRWLLRSDCE